GFGEMPDFFGLLFFGEYAIKELLDAVEHLECLARTGELRSRHARHGMLGRNVFCNRMLDAVQFDVVGRHPKVVQLLDGLARFCAGCEYSHDQVRHGSLLWPVCGCWQYGSGLGHRSGTCWAAPRCCWSVVRGPTHARLKRRSTAGSRALCRGRSVPATTPRTNLN